MLDYSSTKAVVIFSAENHDLAIKRINNGLSLVSFNSDKTFYWNIFPKANMIMISPDGDTVNDITTKDGSASNNADLLATTNQYGGNCWTYVSM